MSIVAVMSDLFFSVSINEAAKKLGTTVSFVKEKNLAMERVKLKPPVVLLDLNCVQADPLGLIRSIKENPETADIAIVGFVSHVQTELRRKAEESGCDMVLARSVFAQDLQAILARYVRPEGVT